MNSESTPPVFHGDDVLPAPPENAMFHVIPVPFEHSVSYGAGTGKGPSALLEASSQLELLTCGIVPADQGIYTAPAVDCTGLPEQVLANIEQSVDSALAAGGMPVVLGGEHTVTYGAVRALSSRFDDFGVIQFDAHADLRDTYEGTRLSHACVMRRIHEMNIPIAQIGTRSYSRKEQEYRVEHQVYYLDSEEIWRHGPVLNLPQDFPSQVYVTFDIDAFDSGVMPATGTPVPGGLHWYQAMWLLEQIMETRTVLGFDVVELAPVPTLHASSFTAAQLVYNMMAYAVKGACKQVDSGES